MMNRPMEMLQNYIFKDLETVLVEICNCMQPAEEYLVTSVVLRPPQVDESSVCERIERVFKENS